MKLTIFHSHKGDSLLLTSRDGKNILADGGMPGSYREHVAPALSRLHERGEELDRVYVSHIDQDHIAGVLELMNDSLDWRVFRHHERDGDRDFRPPGSPEPPAVTAIWHNAFHEQLGKNAGPIEDMLATNASLLSLASPSWARRVAEHSAELAASMNEAVRLSRRIGARQLGIPLNPEYDERLMLVRDAPQPFSVGAFSISVVGPRAEDLEVLRRSWNSWLRSQKGRRQLRKIREDARRDEERLRSDEFRRFVQPFRVEAAELGDRDNVTPPNLASLMLLVEEDDTKVLMTGDGHWQDVLDGLEACGKLDSEGRLHVDVLKIPHHGSEHNSHPDFARKITADHYVFCGNGAHENPDPRIVDLYVESRLGPDSVRSPNAEVGNPFTFWFNASEQLTEPDYRAHMRDLERQVEAAVGRSGGQMTQRFLTGGTLEIELTSTPRVGLRIVAVVPNPAGRDREHEEVRMENTGASAISLEGWRIGDSTGTDFWDLGDSDGTVAPGETVRVIRRGRGMSLNNRGDTVRLIDPAGDVIDGRSYDGPVDSGEIIRFE